MTAEPAEHKSEGRNGMQLYGDVRREAIGGNTISLGVGQ